LEKQRNKRVVVFFYLEDNTLAVTEPKQVNAGTPQGIFLKRQCVMNKNGSGHPLNPDDFKIGE